MTNITPKDIDGALNLYRQVVSARKHPHAMSAAAHLALVTDWNVVRNHTRANLTSDEWDVFCGQLDQIDVEVNL